jgi:DNA-binding response OmpR family regulator
MLNQPVSTPDRFPTDADDGAPGRRVLLVEDNKHTADFLEFMLRRAGYEVLTAGNGRDALEIIANVQPVDIMLLDLMLPYVSGYEIIDRVREDNDWQEVPILVVSGKVLEQDVVATLDQGANDFVSKPLRPQEVLARVRRLLASRARRERTR